MTATMTGKVVHSAPRVLTFITVKRNVPLAGRSYGHWWVEVDGEESYGWWPSRCPLGLVGIIRGTSGTLNGLGVTNDGTRRRDPNHGLIADYEFHPVLVEDRTDDEVRDAIRSFARGFRGGWRWSTRPTMNCRLFQLALMDAAELVDGTGNYYTRGSGCPALAPVRRLAARFDGRRRWPFNLPRPGQRVAELVPRHGPAGRRGGMAEHLLASLTTRGRASTRTWPCARCGCGSCRTTG